MSRATEETNHRLLRARDAMDRAQPRCLDVTALAEAAAGATGPLARSPVQSSSAVAGTGAHGLSWHSP
jgi:hypothetical protein